MKKSDVQFHGEHGGSEHPAINVKVHYVRTPLGASEKAKEWALESYQEQFWGTIETDAQDIFGKGVNVYQEGRSGGWLVVHGLPDVESWDATMLAKWAKFNRIVRAAVDYLKTDTAKKDFAELIAENQWDDEGAEKYNFADLPDGRQVVLSKMKAEARADGFGPVVRG